MVKAPMCWAAWPPASHGITPDVDVVAAVQLPQVRRLLGHHRVPSDPLWLDLVVPEGRHRLADGEAVPTEGFPITHGWTAYPTQALPFVQSPAPLMTPGQQHRAGGWRECNG
jgi:hypothetical protein